MTLSPKPCILTPVHPPVNLFPNYEVWGFRFEKGCLCVCVFLLVLARLRVYPEY